MAILLLLRIHTSPEARSDPLGLLGTEDDVVAVDKHQILLKSALQRLQRALSSVLSVLKHSKPSMIGRGMKSRCICPLKDGYAVQMALPSSLTITTDVFSVAYPIHQQIMLRPTIILVVRKERWRSGPSTGKTTFGNT